MKQPRTKPNPEENSSSLAFEKTQLWLVFAMIFLVTLWIRINSIDSTIVKPPLLILFCSLLVALFLTVSLFRGTIHWHSSALDWLLVVYLSVATVSWICSPYRELGIQPLLLSYAYVVCFFAGTQYFRDNTSAQQLFSVLVIVSVVVCGFALLQFLFGNDLGVIFDLGASRRTPSTLGNANYLGGFLAILIPVILSRIMCSRTPRARWGIILVLLLMVGVLMMTQARSSIVAAVASCILLVALVRSSRPLVVILTAVPVLLIALLLAMAIPGFGERMSELVSFNENISFGRRLVFWRAGASAVLDAPLIGHGPGSHGLVIPRFRESDYWMNSSEDIVPHAHNEFLETAVELGFPGVLVFLIILGVLFRNGFATLRSEKGWKRTTAAGLLCAVAAMLVDNMTNVSFRQGPVGMIVWLLAGVSLSGLFQSRSSGSFMLKFGGGKLFSILPIAAWGLFVWFGGSHASGDFDSDFHHLHGKSLEKKGRRVEAVEEYGQAVSANPENLVAKLDLAMALLRVERRAEALETIRSLRSIVPEYPKSSLVEAITLLELGRLEEASQAIRKEITLRGHPEAYFVQSVILERLNDRAGVWSSLEMVLRMNVRAHSQIHIDNACASLVRMATSHDDLERLTILLRESAGALPENKPLKETLVQVERKLRQTPSAP